jgi:hypothetical protein
MRKHPRPLRPIPLLWGRLHPTRNPSTRPPATWFQFVLPSVADLLFLVLLSSLTMGALAPRLLGDSDIGWHIRNGENMLASHSITRTDTFSSAMTGHPWYAWEWLYDVLIAGIHHLAGLNGVVFATALLVALTFALLFKFLLARGTDLSLAVILLVLTVGASAVHLLARPHVASWLLTLLWFHWLDSAERTGNTRRLYWMPLVIVLWVNLHGGFVVAFILLAIFLGAALSHPRQNRAWIKTLLVVSGLSFLASFVNPYGYQLHLHVHQYLSNRFLMNHIDEFASPNFHGVAQQCFLALLLISIVALAARREEIRLSRLLVMLFAAYSGLYATRNLPVSSMLLALQIGLLLSHAMADGPSFFSRWYAFAERMGKIESRSRGHFWPAFGILLGLLICAGQGKLAGRELMNARFDAKRFPVEAANALEKTGTPETLFAPDYWGGYLIYRFYPGMKVVVDDRHDLYGEAFLRQYLATIHIIPGWKKLLDEENVNWVLVPENSPLANGLKEAGWTVRYSDKTAVLMQK